jgi:hypothetical protein
MVFDDGILADPIKREHAGEIFECGVKCGWQMAYFNKWGGTNVGTGSKFFNFFGGGCLIKCSGTLGSAHFPDFACFHLAGA